MTVYIAKVREEAASTVRQVHVANCDGDRSTYITTVRYDLGIRRGLQMEESSRGLVVKFKLVFVMALDDSSIFLALWAMSYGE